MIANFRLPIADFPLRVVLLVLQIDNWQLAIGNYLAGEMLRSRTT